MLVPWLSHLGSLSRVELVEERVLSRDLILLQRRKRFAAHQEVRPGALHGLHEGAALELAVSLEGTWLLLDEAIQEDAEGQVAQRVAIIKLQRQGEFSGYGGFANRSLRVHHKADTSFKSAMLRGFVFR